MYLTNLALTWLVLPKDFLHFLLEGLTRFDVIKRAINFFLSLLYFWVGSHQNLSYLPTTL